LEKFKAFNFHPLDGIAHEPGSRFPQLIFSLFPPTQISSVNSFDYHTATLVGLLPAQAINVYLGSKLRSIHDVINDNHTAIAGYGMFIFEVIENVPAISSPLLHSI
jgi:hypothetical protein